MGQQVANCLFINHLVSITTFNINFNKGWKTMSKKREFTDVEKQLIIDMYNRGETKDDIRFALHCKSDTLNTFLKDNGLIKRRKNTLKNSSFLRNSQKYKVNEDYFKNIDTPEKAYWLGFLYADGCVHIIYDKKGNKKGSTVELCLQQEDEYHILSFLYDIKATYQIKNKISKLQEKTFVASRVSISNVHFAESLIENGCVPNKSLILKPPLVDDKFMSHFIRGYFDGDGCVHFNKTTKTFSFSVLGTKEMLELIKERTNISKRIHIRKDPRSNVYCLHIRGVDSVKKFYQYIYKDKTVFLQRKWDKALDIMKYLQLDTERSETSALADLLD